MKVATPFASLATLLRGMTSDGVDAAEVAADWTPRLSRALHHAIDVRDAGTFAAERFCDVHFPELFADPMRVVERIYGRFGFPLSGETADRMRAFVAAHGVRLARTSQGDLQRTDWNELAPARTERLDHGQPSVGLVLGNRAHGPFCAVLNQ